MRIEFYLKCGIPFQNSVSEQGTRFLLLDSKTELENGDRYIAINNLPCMVHANEYTGPLL